MALRWWFQNLKQPGNQSISRCGEPDGYEAHNFEVKGDQYAVIVTNRKSVSPDGRRIQVLSQKMKWDDPTGHGIIYIGGNGQVYCYVTPGHLLGESLASCRAEGKQRQATGTLTVLMK